MQACEADAVAAGSSRQHRRARAGCQPSRSRSSPDRSFPQPAPLPAPACSRPLRHISACTLKGTRVQGTIKVETEATLRAKGVRVVGNVQGENARRVNVVRRSRVGGSVQVVQGIFAKVKKSRINADVLYDENSGRLRVVSNRVGGNIQAFKNTGRLEIATNRVDGNLQCKENEPAPTGGGNVVQGNKEDQCASL